MTKNNHFFLHFVQPKMVAQGIERLRVCSSVWPIMIGLSASATHIELFYGGGGRSHIYSAIANYSISVSNIYHILVQALTVELECEDKIISDNCESALSSPWATNFGLTMQLVS